MSTRIAIGLCLIFQVLILSGQNVSTTKKLTFTGDFRFRVEHDWNSQKADGSFRDDRSRLRYRFRFGMNYQLNNWASFGARLRSGNINDQQGPHITLGSNKGEFGLTQIGFEKLFLKIDKKWMKIYAGKFDFPFEKQNELFWNNNVFPEGVAVKFQKKFDSGNLLKSAEITASHFIISSENTTFNNDRYLQAIQLNLNTSIADLKIFPGFYKFNKIGNIPDGKESYNLDYQIFHLGTAFTVSRDLKLKFGADFYSNLVNYEDQIQIEEDLRDQKSGFVLNLKWGDLKSKGNFIVYLYYAALQKFAVVDYFAQNDWARWDYSGYDASGARLTNFQGSEIRIGYAIDKNFNVILRTYFVKQLIKTGSHPETGNRIRIDFNAKF